MTLDGERSILGLSGKVALITGGGAGIGRCTAELFARAGMCVAVAEISGERAEETRAALLAAGCDSLVVQTDVRDGGQTQRLLDDVATRFGRLDVLVNNAAIHYDPSARALTPDWTVIREAFETNVFGAWRVAVAFAPLLGASGHGRLVNVSSEGGSLASMGAGAPAYSTSKATLNALTRILAAEFRSAGVLVNSVCPGWVATDMGGPGGCPVAQGAAGIVWAATLPDDGPTGGFFRDGKSLSW